MEPDDLFAQPLADIVDFRFDAQVARVFPDMLRRSVPGYGTLIALTGVLAAQYAQAGTTIYDLGCSLGASTLAMAHRITAPDCRILAVDNAPAMVERCREHLSRETPPVPVEVLEADLLDIRPDNASVVVLNLTLQFIPPARRDALIRSIHDGLRPGGVLLLTEKTAQESAPFEDLYAAFKRANGYSELEISQKRTALENVLVPETADAHVARLHGAGFAAVHPWFRCLQFESFLAIRT